jgi:adenylate kinase family enzyme
MARVILIAGLPGSGKTTYGSKLKVDVNAAGFVDDYHAKAIENSPKFEHGRQYAQLIGGLMKGETWIASDIAWCLPEKRREVEKALRAVVPGVIIEWHFMATDEEKCRKRVEKRRRATVDEELRKITELCRYYHIPPGSKVVDDCEGAAEPDVTADQEG